MNFPKNYIWYSSADFFKALYRNYSINPFEKISENSSCFRDFYKSSIRHLSRNSPGISAGIPLVIFQKIPLGTPLEISPRIPFGIPPKIFPVIHRAIFLRIPPEIPLVIPPKIFSNVLLGIPLKILLIIPGPSAYSN